MICRDCGTVLPEEANFCFHCGVKVSDRIISPIKRKSESCVELVLLKCPGCGAAIECNAKETQGTCNHCGSKFLIREHINNSASTTNVNIGTNANAVNLLTLIKRGQEFEAQGDCDKATQYYNEALDIDYANKEARTGLARIKLENVEALINIGKYNQAQDLYMEIINSEHQVLVDEARIRFDALNELIAANYESVVLHNYEKAIERFLAIKGSPAIERKAKENIELAKKYIKDFVYLSSVIDNSNIGDTLQLQVRMEGLYLKNLNSGTERKFSLKYIMNVTAGFNETLTFDYRGMEYNFNVKQLSLFTKCLRALAKGEILDRSKTRTEMVNGVMEYIREK